MFRDPFQKPLPMHAPSFPASANPAERLSQLRDDRIQGILHGDTPIKLPSGPKMVFNLVPLSVLDPAARIDVTKLGVHLDQLALEPHYNCAHANAAGYLRYIDPEDAATFYGYVQLYRTGTIEAVERPHLKRIDDKCFIATPAFDIRLAEIIDKNIEAQRTSLHLTGPIGVTVSLVSCSGLRPWSPRGHQATAREFDTEHLPFPEIIIPESSFDPWRDLKPLHDTFWQAWGFSHSPYYRDGKFSPDNPLLTW